MSKSLLTVFVFLFSTIVTAQTKTLPEKLKGLDEYMAKTLKDWNTPGAGVAVVKNGQVIWMKGYGYRDYDKKLPVTSTTLFQIASNTKLFTATAVGMLVEQGKLEWDKPVKSFVPSIKFYNNELDNTVTIRDMLSHRTGISRHDLIWYKSDFTRAQLFEKLKYLEPSQPIRQSFLYNNLMYAASGQIIELLTQKKWEAYLQENILNPLNMKSTVFSIADMRRNPDHFVPYNERRDTSLLYQVPWLEDTDGLGPAGSLISNLEDMSHWLIAQMNSGMYNGKAVIPNSVIKATLEPSIPEFNGSLAKGYTEMLNPVYGMGRGTVSYRGHLLADHGGDLTGIHSQISFMPQDSLGVIVFVIGDQGQPLYNIISYNIYERLLGMSLTPWSERRLAEMKKGKQAGREGRKAAGIGQVKGTKPSHPLDDYLGDFANDTYGTIHITKHGSDSMQFAFHDISLPMGHFHYDRFDTPNDEVDGLFSINYRTSPQGEVDGFDISLDEGNAVFNRVADASLSTLATLNNYTGKYQIGSTIIEVVVKNDNKLFAVIPGTPQLELIPYKARVFKSKDYPDLILEFMITDGKVTAMKQKDPSGEYVIKRMQ